MIAEKYNYSASFEAALVYRSIASPGMWQAIGRWLDPEHMHGSAGQLLVKGAQAVARETGAPPEGDLQVLQRVARWYSEGKIAEDVWIEVNVYLTGAQQIAAPYTDRAITLEAVPPLRRTANILLMKAHVDAVTTGQSGFTTQLQERIAELDKIGVSTVSTGIGVDTDIDSLWGLLDMPRYSTGSSLLDTVMGGGLVNPGMTVFVANAGAGKSRQLTQTIVANLLLGHDCVVATLELPEAVVMANIIGCLTNVITKPLVEKDQPSRDACRRMATDRLKRLMATGKLGRWWVQYHPSSTSYATLIAWKDRIVREKGFNLKLFVTDYADKVGAGTTSDRGYEGARIIYDGFRDDALVNKYLHVTASQPKRTDKPRPLIDEDDLSDSQHKIRIVEHAISLNPELALDGAPPSNYAKYFVIKDRYGVSKVGTPKFLMHRDFGGFSEFDAVARPFDLPPYRGEQGILYAP